MSDARVISERPVRRSFAIGLALAWLLCQSAYCVARGAPATDQAESPSVQAQTPALAVPLPNTDGEGLLARAPAFEGAAQKLLFAKGRAACDVDCASAFGTELGSADGVPGLSNCAPTCIRQRYSFIDLGTGAVAVHAQDPHAKNLRYAGITYQCVEYARRWWMQRLGIAFGDVDGASDILYLTQAEDIRTGQAVALARSVNGTALRPPKKGDLIVYYPDRRHPNWRFGHVAVAVDVDPVRGSVALAEQNYSNAPWEDAKGFARRIRLFSVGGRFTLVDVSLTEVANPDGGRIAGWLYPLSAE
jgi:hypothetical protein